MITITNNAVYRTDFPLVDHQNYENIQVIDDSEILMYLTDSVQLGESLKFKRLFEIIAANTEVFNIIFYSSLGGHPIDPYLQEIQNIPTETPQFDYLEVSWSCENYNSTVSISPMFHGVGSDKGEELTYALDFTPLNNIQNMRLRLNDTMLMYKYGKKKPSRKHLGNMGFTVFDLFGCILYEISFHGGPNDKKERLQELDNSISESEKMLEEGDMEPVEWDDMIKEMEAKDIYLVRYKNLRDRVNEDLVKGNDLNKLKNCLREKLKIYYKIISSNEADLKDYYKKLTDIEYNLQTLYNIPEDIKYHKFWETPRCICPKIDNIEIYPSETPVFDVNCPIHKK